MLLLTDITTFTGINVEDLDTFQRHCKQVVHLRLELLKRHVLNTHTISVYRNKG